MADEVASASQRALDEGYEPSDVRIGGVVLVAAVSLGTLILIGLALAGMVRWFGAESEPQVPSAPIAAAVGGVSIRARSIAVTYGKRNGQDAGYSSRERQHGGLRSHRAANGSLRAPVWLRLRRPGFQWAHLRRRLRNRRW